jgi:hypothetical protein
VQRAPDRISVLESRGLLEGLVGEVSTRVQSVVAIIAAIPSLYSM